MEKEKIPVRLSRDFYNLSSFLIIHSPAAIIHDNLAAYGKRRFIISQTSPDLPES